MPQLNKRNFRHSQTSQNAHGNSSTIPHQTCSVPTTPMRSSRDRKRRIQSPSPGQKQQSPQSVVSDGPDSRSLLSRSRNSCPFESTACLGRRRIPYNIGDDPLPRLQDVKESLSPAEERGLASAADLMYKKLLPSPESEDRRRQFSSKLRRLLDAKWPGYRFDVHVFGSSGNLLCTSDSDVDICIETDFKELESMHILADLLATNGMEKVVCVSSAKVPIVKIWDPALRLSCDMNVNNTLALDNTRMVRTYVQLDPRVRPLAMIVKHWTKQRILNDAAIGGTFSSYTWICMIINFLQTRQPPLLPALHQLPHKPKISPSGVDTGFADDVASLQGKSRNTETLAQLLFAFFRRYGHELNYDESVLSVRHGKVLSRKEKGWETSSKDGQWRLCVEEPFSICRNLGNSADSTAFRGIHLELRRAFDLLSVGKLESVCEEYIWPQQSDEKTSTNSSIFQKPSSSQSKPVLLSQPPSRTNRVNGNGSHSRNRHNPGPKGPPSFRRMSNSSQYGSSFNNQQFAPGSPILNYVHSSDNLFLFPPGDAALRANSFIPISLATNPRIPFLVAPHQYSFVPYSTALSASGLAAWTVAQTAHMQTQAQSQPQVSTPKPSYHHIVSANSTLSNISHRASTGALSPPKSSLLQTPLSSTVPTSSCLFEDSSTGIHEPSTFGFRSTAQDRQDSDTSSPLSDQENIHRSSVSDVSTEWAAPQASAASLYPEIIPEAPTSARIPVPKTTGSAGASQYLNRPEFRAGSTGTLSGASPNVYSRWVVSPDGNHSSRQTYSQLDMAQLPRPDSPSKARPSESFGDSTAGSKRNSRSLSPLKIVDDHPSPSDGPFSPNGGSPTEATHDGSILIANGSHMLPKTPGNDTPDSNLTFWNYGFGYDWVQGQDGAVYHIPRPVDASQYPHSYGNQENVDNSWLDSDATQFHLETTAPRETPFDPESDASRETSQAQASRWVSQLSENFGRSSLYDLGTSLEPGVDSHVLSPVQESVSSNSPHAVPASSKVEKPKLQKLQQSVSNGLRAPARLGGDDHVNAETKQGRAVDANGKPLSHIESNQTSRNPGSRSRRSSNVVKGKVSEQWQWQTVPSRGKQTLKPADEKVPLVSINDPERKGG